MHSIAPKVICPYSNYNCSVLLRQALLRSAPSENCVFVRHKFLPNKCRGASNEICMLCRWCSHQAAHWPSDVKPFTFFVLQLQTQLSIKQRFRGGCPLKFRGDPPYFPGGGTVRPTGLTLTAVSPTAVIVGATAIRAGAMLTPIGLHSHMKVTSVKCAQRWGICPRLRTPCKLFPT